MKKLLYMALCAAIAITAYGCRNSDKETIQTIDTMLSEKAQEAEKFTPSDIVDVRLFYLDGDKVVEEPCRGFVFHSPNPMANIGIMLGTTNKKLAEKPFVYSFPVEEGSAPFTTVTTPKSTEIVARDSKHGKDIYIIGFSSVKDAFPSVVPDGIHDDSQIRSYIFVLSTLN